MNANETMHETQPTPITLAEQIAEVTRWLKLCERAQSMYGAELGEAEAMYAALIASLEQLASLQSRLAEVTALLRDSRKKFGVLACAAEDDHDGFTYEEIAEFAAAGAHAIDAALAGEPK